jgi:hypothetical protein
VIGCLFSSHLLWTNIDCAYCMAIIMLICWFVFFISMIWRLSFVSSSFIIGMWVVALALATKTMSGATFHPLHATLLTSGWYFVVFSLKSFCIITICKFYKLYGDSWCRGFAWRVILWVTYIFDTFNKWSPREDKRMVKLDWLIDLLFFSKLPFLNMYLKKISTLIFWCMVILLGPHSVYT